MALLDRPELDTEDDRLILRELLEHARARARALFGEGQPETVDQAADERRLKSSPRRSSTSISARCCFRLKEDSSAIPIPVANSSRLSQKACEGRMPGACPRRPGQPVRHTHEVEGRCDQDVTEMGSEQASVARVPHSTTPHTLRDRAFDSGAARIRVNVVTSGLLCSALSQSFVLFLRPNGDTAPGVLCS